MKHKKIICYISLSFILVLAFASCTSKSAETAGTTADQTVKSQAQLTYEGKPLTVVSASYVDDVSDPEVATREADYVFAGRIDKLIDTAKQPYGEGSIPHTSYSVTVLENIKGDLVLDAPIIVAKEGGYDQVSGSYILYEDDRLPVAGKTYIMLAFTQMDGSLLMSGVNSTIEASLGMDKEKDPSWKIYTEAYEKVKDQKKKNGDQFTISKYDRNPNNPEPGEQTYQALAEKENARASLADRH